MNLDWDEWDGVVCYEHADEGCSAEEAAVALRRLDQRRHTLMTVRGEALLLTIGGGDDRYIIFVQEEDTGEIWEARTRRGVASMIERVMVVAGGQEGDFSPDQVLAHDEAHQILEDFFASESRSTTVDWVIA